MTINVIFLWSHDHPQHLKIKTRFLKSNVFVFFYDGMAGINMMVNFVIFIMVIKSMKIKVDNIVPL